MDYDEINDYELIEMVHESSDEAKDILFEKYKYIIDIEIKKYIRGCRGTRYDYNDLYQDALLGFSDAIHSYREDKKTALPTFITLCVDRKINASIIKASRLKNKMLTNSLSLDHVYNIDSSPLKDLISDNFKNDPLENIVKEEKMEDLNNLIKEKLSQREYDVFLLMLNGHKYSEIAVILNKSLKQVDNTIQRVKNKLKLIIIEFYK